MVHFLLDQTLKRMDHSGKTQTPEQCKLIMRSSTFHIQIALKIDKNTYRWFCRSSKGWGEWVFSAKRIDRRGWMSRFFEKFRFLERIPIGWVRQPTILTIQTRKWITTERTILFKFRKKKWHHKQIFVKQNCNKVLYVKMRRSSVHFVAVRVWRE